MNNTALPEVSRGLCWLKFAGGLLLLVAIIAFLGWGPMPPGYVGKVVRHNLEVGQDATALFYSEVDDFHGWANGQRFDSPAPAASHPGQVVNR